MNELMAILERWDHARAAQRRAWTADEQISAEWAEWEAEQEYHRKREDLAAEYLFARRVVRDVYPTILADESHRDVEELLNRVKKLESLCETMHSALLTLSGELNSVTSMVKAEMERMENQRTAAVRAAQSATRPMIQTRN